MELQVALNKGIELQRHMHTIGAPAQFLPGCLRCPFAGKPRRRQRNGQPRFDQVVNLTAQHQRRPVDAVDDGIGEIRADKDAFALPRLRNARGAFLASWRHIG